MEDYGNVAKYWESNDLATTLKRKFSRLEKIKEAKQLLKEALEFLNKVPNKKYGDNYKLTSKIDKFLK